MNKTHPKNFAKTSLILKNPKFFIKPQKLGHKRWNAWKRRIRTLTKWRKTWSRPKNPEEEVWSEWERFWKVKSQERLSEMSLRSRKPFIYKLNNSWQVERCRALKGSTDAAIEQVSKAKRISMDRGSVEELLRGQKVTRSIDLAIEKCQDCNIKQLKSSVDKQLKSSIKSNWRAQELKP